MLPTRATAAALLLLAIVFPDGGGKAEAKGLSPPPQPIDDKEQADADAAEAASSRAASHDGADSGLTLPDAVSAVKENEAKLQQHTHSKKKRNRNKKKNGPHSHRPRPRISNYGTCLTQSSRAHDCMNANDSFSPKNSDHHGGGHHTSTRYKDPSHTVLDDFVQGLARVGVEMLDLKVDLLGDMADVLRKNKFGHRLDEFEKPSLYHSNVQEKKDDNEKSKEKDKQKFLDVNDGGGNAKSGEKDGNAEERTDKGAKEKDTSHSGHHPVNVIANGLRHFGIGILDVERSAVSGIRNILRDWRDGMVLNTSKNSPERRRF